MQLFEAPAEYPGAPRPALFLAGGLTGYPGWQDEVASALADLPLAVLNPRVRDYPTDPAAEEVQIGWEFRHLRAADAVLFWFPAESACPVTLFELGSVVGGSKPLFIGAHPRYPKRQNLVFQMKLVRPGAAVAAELAEVIAAVRAWAAAS
jgi:Nucleoside 2-deoxyribosyltransferase like